MTLKVRNQLEAVKERTRFLIPRMMAIKSKLEVVEDFWDKEGKLNLFNARDDKVATSSAFKGPLTRSRCIIPASYFYEWQKTEHGKIPYAIHRTDGQALLFAG